jgi:hypothetical protein
LNDEGSVEVNKLFERIRFVKANKFPREDGREPVICAPIVSKEFNLDNFPSDEGKEPWIGAPNSAAESDKEIISLLSQEIPGQLQIYESGIEPVQLQPLPLAINQIFVV